jgi:hypothetical protein
MTNTKKQTNNKKFKSKKTLKVVNKCLEKKSTLQPLPLSYFKNLAIKIFKILEENNSQTKKKCIDILQNFPFCEKNNTLKFKYLQGIFQNNLFTKNEKKRRITSALIDMAWEYMTTKNADIGSLSSDGNPPHLFRPIKEEYQYYKNVHNLKEKRYSYM